MENEILEVFGEDIDWINTYRKHGWKVIYSHQHKMAIFEKGSEQTKNYTWFPISMSENQLDLESDLDN